jgi:hypothetical protein
MMRFDPARDAPLRTNWSMPSSANVAEKSGTIAETYSTKEKGPPKQPLILFPIAGISP